MRAFFFLRLCVVFFVAGFDVVASVVEVVVVDADVAAVFDADVPGDVAAVFDADVAAVFDAEVPADVSAVFDAEVPADVAAVFADVGSLDDESAALDAEPALGFAALPLDVDEPALADPEPARFVVVDESLPGADDVDAVDDKPSASRYAPAPARATSTSSTATMSPMRRFGAGIGIESSVSRGRRCCDVGFMLCADAGAAPFFDCEGAGAASGACCAACGLLGLRWTLGVRG